MIRLARNIAAALALTSLVVAQPAVAKRSAESLPAVGAKLTSPEGQRLGSIQGQSEQLRGGFIIPLIALIAILLGILALTQGHHHNESPG